MSFIADLGSQVIECCRDAVGARPCVFVLVTGDEDAIEPFMAAMMDVVGLRRVNSEASGAIGLFYESADGNMRFHVLDKNNAQKKLCTKDSTDRFIYVHRIWTADIGCIARELGEWLGYKGESVPMAAIFFEPAGKPYIQDDSMLPVGNIMHAVTHCMYAKHSLYDVNMFAFRQEHPGGLKPLLRWLNDDPENQ